MTEYEKQLREEIEKEKQEEEFYSNYLLVKNAKNDSEYKIGKETDKAIQIISVNHETWLPKSQISITKIFALRFEKEYEYQVIKIPAWVKEEKGLNVLSSSDAKRLFTNKVVRIEK